MTSNGGTVAVRSTPQPQVTIYVDGIFDPVLGRVRGGTLAAADPLPDKEGSVLIIGRDEECHVRVPRATTAMSRKPVQVARQGGRYVAWVASASGGHIYQPGPRQSVAVPAATPEDPDPTMVLVEVLDGTTVELVSAREHSVHLVFDIPHGAVQPPPVRAGSANEPDSEVVGRANYALTDADRELLTALACDLVSPPFILRPRASRPVHIVEMLRQSAVSYFDNKGPRDTYTEKKLKHTLEALVGRLEAAEAVASIPRERRLTTYVESFHADSIATGVFHWLDECGTELTSTLDFDLAVEMQEFRDDLISAHQAARRLAGARAVAQAKSIALPTGQDRNLAEPGR